MHGTTARFGARASAVTLAGVLLSGPVAAALVAAVAPQPAWIDAATFARHYDPVQLAPYALGVLLVVGSVMMVAAAYRASGHDLRPRAALALVLSAVFASFVLLNYALQTVVVPGLVRGPVDGASSSAIELLTMSNPRSIAWTLETWGYGFRGAAMWLVAPAFGGSRLERAVRRLCVADGVVSIAAAAAMLGGADWLASPAGLAAFVAWNALVAALAGASVVLWRRRAARHDPHAARRRLVAA